MSYKTLLQNEETLEKLNAAESDEEMISVMIENGATEEDAHQFIADLETSVDGEIPEDLLELVSGGGKPYLQILIAKTAYRVKHGKVLVKATYDEDRRVITCSNRVGKNKVYEEYDY